MSPSQKNFLTPDELEMEYQFGKKWQDRMRSKKLIPFIKIGGYVRYSRVEIEKWILKHAVVVE
jgi:hypothetical protein